MAAGSRTLRWVGAMAWRDSRGSRGRLGLAAGVVAVGVAALTAVSSFRENVHDAVALQAKSLLGADLVLSSRRPFPPEAEALLAALPGDQSREVSFSSMAYFPSAGGSRLTQVRAVEGGFPYYGVLETEPPAAARAFRSGTNALVDDGLLLQFGVPVGESVKLGAATFRITGRLKKIPGETAANTLLGPRVYIPMAALPQTALIQKGSRVTYKAAFRLPAGADVQRLLEPLQPRLDALRVESDTVARRAARVGRVMENLVHFLNLVGFIAVLLGGVGVASATHVYIGEKLATVATLRCLGARARETFAIYLTQAAALGGLGGLTGVIGGVAVQQLLPRVLSDFLPVHIAAGVSWGGVGTGGAVGVGVVFVFALLPLLPVRRVPPLLALRAAYETAPPRARDPLRHAVFLLIALGVALFAFAHTERWTYGAAFCGVLAAAFGLLAGLAALLTRVVRTHLSPALPYVWRQGLANLYRPNNQTLVLMLALGTGTFLTGTLSVVQYLLIEQVRRVGEGDQPNLVLFDIQGDQRDGVAGLVRSFSLPVLQDVPLVTMRLAAVKGEDVADLRRAAEGRGTEWALQWEYRATYRGYVTETETVTAGVWLGAVRPGASPVPVSLEEEIARTVGVTLGDEIVFDVQGVPLAATVASVRKVDWQRVQPNFFVVFPTGVLEAAPQTYVLVTRTATGAQSAAVQRALVRQFPNVSSVDLTMILQTFDAVLRRIAFAIRFMGLFSAAAGVLVLTGAVVAGRHQREQEGALLRALGASRRQVRAVLAAEYLLLGGVAALTGLLLAALGSWALATFLFEVPFAVPARFLVLTWLAVTGVTVAAGALGSRAAAACPPLEVLRRGG